MVVAGHRGRLDRTQ